MREGISGRNGRKEEKKRSKEGRKGVRKGARKDGMKYDKGQGRKEEKKW